MRSVAAIFMKQSQDILRNMGVLVQFVVFPGVAFIMTWVLNVRMEGLSDGFFVSTLASMFIGMTLTSASATAIAEDREKKSIRFLLMAGVKSHQYLIGVGGVFFVFALIASSTFALMMPNLHLSQRLIMLFSLLMGAAASILIGAIIEMATKNEQSAISISTAVGMVIGFVPLLAAFNETISKIFGIFYTMNFIYNDFSAVDIARRLLVIVVNILVLIVLFSWVYKRQGLKT